MKAKNFSYKLTGSFILLILVSLIAMRFGAADTSLKDVWFAVTSSKKTDTVTMLQEIRFPRIIATIFVGAALAVAGAIMQGVTRNPLADPGLLGVSAGANVALAMTMAFIPVANYFSIMIACFIGATIGTLLVIGIGAISNSGFSALRIVLAGSAVSAFLYAIADGIAIYFDISKDVSMWTAGGFIGTNWSQLQVVLPFIAVTLIVSLLFSRQLSLLSLNEDVAVGLGQNILVIKAVLFLLISLLAGASVALVGNLAFVGLMIPHVVRAIVGSDYRNILPMSMIIGAAFLVAAETIGRTINAPYETSVAAIISIIGLPFFLIIVRKGAKQI
ncbi:iron complex transport system permease protein [Gracilibacillus ureilyticus]|uniref:Iron complex transport system permease protein n=1 Tax=Gracilibacillus ureilyticus TaxID=531814 RepID=A0A1H9Q658_9BACI|nr:iron ABC transporter permease [Gracilibacillus ureilyticus]SER55902.1 iron complex transport system permease protein [Gracilibacillus ureilyticus]